MSGGIKKLLPLYILDILKQYTDEDNMLVTREILDVLRNEYDIECERKAVGRNIEWLIEYGYDISTYDENKTGYYLRERVFEESELRLLVDGVLSSRYVPQSHVDTLIDKLKGMHSHHFSKKLNNITSVKDWVHTENKSLFYNIDIIDEAIEQSRKIDFVYNEYDVDKKLHPRRKKRYLLNPYQIVVVMGKYYLIGNNDRYDNLAHYRLDKITNIKINDMKQKPINELPGYEGGLNTPQYVQTMLHMLGGEVLRCELEISEYMIGTVMDTFGDNAHMKRNTDNSIIASLQGSADGLKHFILQFGSDCRVISPDHLKDMVIDEIDRMRDLYSK